MSFFALVLLGAAASWDLPISLLPETDIPRVSVQVEYPNRSAREIEEIVVAPLRLILLQSEQLKSIKSTARAGAGVIELQFNFGTNMDLAFIEVNEKIDQAATLLPKEVKRPRAVKAQLADIPVFYLSVTPHNVNSADFMELSQLSRYAIKRRVEQLPQIAFADITGYTELEVIVEPDPAMLRTSGLTAVDFAAVLEDYNLESQQIRIKDGQYEYNLNVELKPHTIQDIERLPVRHEGRLMRIKDIAKVRLRAAKTDGQYWYNGKRGVSMAVYKNPNSSLFELKQEAQQLLEALRGDYPRFSFELVNDQTALLRLAIVNLFKSIGFGCLFAFLVLFLFLRNWRYPLLIGLSLPVGLFLAMIGFHALGLSINIISLGGLLLGIGLMIDNAIIVVSNIQQFYEKGDPIEQACINGANEVIRPLISAVATTSCVFLPLILMSGLAGQLFYEQAVSVTLVLLSSLLVAYFFIPVLLRSLQKPRNNQISPVPSRLSRWYRLSADWASRRPAIVSLTFLLLLLGALWGLGRLPKRLFPDLKRQGVVCQLEWNQPVSIQENLKRCQALQKELGGFERSELYVGRPQFMFSERQMPLNTAKILFWDKSAAHASDKDQAANSQLGKLPFTSTFRALLNRRYPEAEVQIQAISTLFDQIFGSSLPAAVLHLSPTQADGPVAVSDLRGLMAYFEEKGIEYQMPPVEEQLFVDIDEVALLRYGVERQAVIEQLQIQLEGYRLGTLAGNREDISILWAVQEQPIEKVLSQAIVTNEAGQNVPLKKFVRFFERQTWQHLTAVKATETVNIVLPALREGQLSEISSDLAQHSTWQFSLSGRLLERRIQFEELTAIILLSLGLLYLVLAAQFESLLQPFIVLFVLPFSMAGAVLMLWITNQSLNLIALTGLVIMVGVVVNDAILKVDMINRIHKQTNDLRHAIHLAGTRRLNAILMTSLTTILALLPVLFSGGLGADLQRPLAFTIIGGLLVGTLASLYLIPLLYMGWSRLVTPRS